MHHDAQEPQRLHRGFTPEGVHHTQHCTGGLNAATGCCCFSAPDTRLHSNMKVCLPLLVDFYLCLINVLLWFSADPGTPFPECQHSLQKTWKHWEYGKTKIQFTGRSQLMNNWHALLRLDRCVPFCTWLDVRASRCLSSVCCRFPNPKHEAQLRRACGISQQPVCD